MCPQRRRLSRIGWERCGSCEHKELLTGTLHWIFLFGQEPVICLSVFTDSSIINSFLSPLYRSDAFTPWLL